MPVVNAAIEMDAPQRARQEILDALTPYLEKTKLRVFGHDVLIAVYNRSGQKTAGGIYIPDANREDEFQGVIGLIVAMGPLASDNNPEFVEWFGGQHPKLGDWIGFNIRDGVAYKVGGTTCRLIEWKYLRLGVAVPDLVM